MYYDPEIYTQLGFSDEQVECWNDTQYLKIDPKDGLVFDYLDEITVALINGKRIPVNEINFIGSRLSSKTFSIIKNVVVKLIVSAIANNKRVAIYGFREMGKDIQEFKKDFDTWLEEFNIPESTSKLDITPGTLYKYTNNSNTPLYKFKGGSFIQLKGLNNSKNEKVSLKGLASCKDYDLAISIVDEADELTQKEFNAIDFAIRGSRQYLKVRCCNPESVFRYFVGYMNDRFPANKEELEDKGQMFKVIRENGINKVFHWSNFQVNPFIDKDKILQFRELKKLDPDQYLVWGIGMPGATSGAVFSRYLLDTNKYKSFTPVSLYGGVDLGQSDGLEGHPTCAMLVGQDRLGNLKPVREYFHSNAFQKHKDPNEIARDIVEFYLSPILELDEIYKRLNNGYTQIDDELNERINNLEELANIISQGLEVKVDYGAGGLYMINTLNQIREKYYRDYDFLVFKPVDKSLWFIKDRVDATISMLVSNSLLIDEQSTPELVRQMNLMRYKEPSTNKSSHKIEIIDLNDDCWDAMCYAIMDKLNNVLRNVKARNEFLVNKHYKMDNKEEN